MTKKRNPFRGVGNQPTTDRHGKKRWRLRTTIKGRRVDTYLPGKYGSLEFRAAYDAAVNFDQSGPATMGKAGTFAHTISHYKGSNKFTSLAYSTRYGKSKRLEWINLLIGSANMSELEVRHIENLMDRKGGPNAANRLLKELSELFDYARKKIGQKVTNPTTLVEKRQTPQGGHHTWSDQEVTKYRAAHQSGTKARLALELMLATGAARQDACAIGRHSIIEGNLHYARKKTGQEATLPLSLMPRLIEELIHLSPETGLFLTHGDGQAYTPEGFGNWFREQCRKADIPDKCSAHGLRKYGATKLAEAGATEFQIMAFLAHKSTHEAMTYVRDAQRKKLAADGMALVHQGKASNLPDWLDKSAKQLIEREVEK